MEQLKLFTLTSKNTGNISKKPTCLKKAKMEYDIKTKFNKELTKERLIRQRNDVLVWL